MKEYGPKFGAENMHSALTRNPNNPTLEVKGNIFMAEGSGRVGTLTREASSVKPATKDINIQASVPPERIEKARAEWDKLGSSKDPHENSTREMLARMGVTPMRGGAAAIDVGGYTDGKIIRVIEEINSQVDLVNLDDPNKHIGSDYISEQRVRLRKLLDDGNLDQPDEAQKLIKYLNQIDKEFKDADDAKKLEREKQYRRQHGIGEITKNYEPDVLLTDPEKRDEVFNEIFAGVDSNPHEFWDRAFPQLTRGLDLEAFMDLIRNGSTGRVDEYGITKALTSAEQDRLKKDLQRYQIEANVRKTLHDVNAVLYLPSINGEQIWQNMQMFESAMGDFAMRQAGVAEMMDLFEAALREDMAEHEGYLRPEAVRGVVSNILEKKTNEEGEEIEGDEEGEEDSRKTYTYLGPAEVEKKTKDRFREMMNKGILYQRTDDFKTRKVGQLEEWEVDRVFTIARGMMIMNERLISIAAESKLPKGSGVYTSLFMQDILQNYSPYVHLLAKYGVTESGLAAYLYKDKEGATIMDRLGLWSGGGDLKKALDKMVDSPQEFLDSTEFRYLMKANPNMAGDIFTWLSWRASDKPDVVSMSKRFLEQGLKGMGQRFIKEHGLPLDTDLEIEMPGVDYRAYLKDPHDEVTKEDRAAVNAFVLTHPGASFTRNDPRINDIRKTLGEYSNWMGTAIRFEKLRGGLNGHHVKSIAEKKMKHRVAVEQARDIFEQMARLQPHRLYAVSKDIRGRVGTLLSAEEKKNMSQTLGDLHILERALLRDRERLLDEGKTFATVSLDEFYSEIKLGEEEWANATPEVREAMALQRRANAKHLAELIRIDYRTQSNSNDGDNAYIKEFITDREYKHAFVLWSGDAPVNEFNASALGATGMYARRARDNKNQSEAAVEEIKLLGSLSSLQTPQQAVQALHAIFEKISAYDAGKAKEAIAEKAEGLIKFFAADWITQIPVVGSLKGMTMKSSFAQLVYGKSAAVWQPSEARSFLMQLKDKQMISEVHYAELQDKGMASNLAVGRDMVVTIAEILAIVMAIYMFQEVRKGEQGGGGR